MRTVTKISQLTVAAALGLSLAACGSSSSSSGSTSAGGAGSSASTASGASSAPSASPSSSSSSSSTAPGSDQAGAPDAKSLVHQARSAYRAAKSAHLHARIKQDTKVETIDIKGTVDGSNQDATISETGQGTAAFRTVSNKTYIKADQTFWTTAGKLTKPVAAKVADKWVVAPPSTKSQLSSITIKYFLDSVLGESNLSDSELGKSKTKKSSYNGKDVYVITDESPNGGSLTLAGDTKDFLRLLPPANQSDEGAVTADGWNQQPSVTAPAGAIDPQSLK
ncbi:hypothetical protein [Flexivirga alba]|jgi:hypothetical protein|uniref:LppX_LprAFG lipoprotein n=1 Tax=Flexivirga alba TaxID=702742 RepID=A0ABW2ADI7_9MICO